MQRARTMGSVLRSVSTGVIATVVVLMVLAELGLNIGPLLASAGILGVALGFGAQSLVKDFLSGLFMIVEDQYGVGDVVDLGEASGTVEAVGLRVTRLRSVDGTVWYVPNGQIQRVGNQSQGWARAVLDIAVAYGEDVTRVQGLLAQVGHDLHADPEWAPLVMEEPEVWGVEALSADSVVVRLVVKTVPLEQWRVARELRRTDQGRVRRRGRRDPVPAAHGLDARRAHARPPRRGLSHGRAGLAGVGRHGAGGRRLPGQGGGARPGPGAPPAVVGVGLVAADLLPAVRGASSRSCSSAARSSTAAGAASRPRSTW